MAQNAINNLVNNRDKIRQLMAMDGKMDQIVESARMNGTLVGSDDGATYTQPSTKPTQPLGLGSVVVNEEVMSKHSKMPRAILESFQKNPGQTMPLPSGMGGSVLDGIDIPVQKRVPMVNEQAVSSPVMAPANNIDYSLLRTIINEAVQENVKKYMSALSKKLISEGMGNKNAASIEAIKFGDKCSVILSNGDIYEAQGFKFKYNINKKMHD